MTPVQKLAEKVTALSLALNFLKSAEPHAPVAARLGAERVLQELQALELEKP